MSIVTRCLLIVFSSLLSVLSLSAGTGRFFTPDNELSSSLVNYIMQDREGYVWVATEYGLNRSDGTGFGVYRNDPSDSTSLRHNYVRTIHEDSSGRLRVGCINGLMEFDRATDSFRDIPLYDRGRRVYPHVASMLELSDGSLWVATLGNGIFKVDSSGRRADRLDKVSRIVGNDYVTVLCEDDTHAVWVGTERNGLCRYYPSSGVGRSYGEDELPGVKVSDITLSPRGDVMVGLLDNGGVAVYDRAADRFTLPVASLAGLPVKSIAFVEDDMLVATEGRGVKRLRAWTVEDYLLDDPAVDLAKAKVHHIMKDRDGNLWLAIFQQGVYLSGHRRVKFGYMGCRRKDNPIGEGCVMTVFGDSRGDVWVSCDNDGIYRVNDVTGERLARYPLAETALKFFEDRSGRLWVGTYGGGLLSLDRSTGRLSAVAELAGTRVYGIDEDENGAIYAATLGDGVFRLDPSGGEAVQFRAGKGGAGDPAASVPSDWVNDVRIDSRGRVWLATYAGVMRLDPVSGTISPVRGLEGVIAYNIEEVHDGRICAGTVGGLRIIDADRGKIENVTMADGLPNDVVCGIVEDASHNLWLSSYRGISRYNPSTGRVMSFDSGDGLQGNEFTHGAFCSAPDGKIFFGGTYGVTSFHPYDISEDARRYMPRIVRFDIFGAPVNATTLSDGRSVVDGDLSEAREVTLGPSDNTFTVHFSTMTFDNPDKIVYCYRIPELSARWLNTAPGTNKVTFNNLSPGTYTFQVKVDGDDRPEGVTSLTVTIIPPWYQSWWAFGIYLLLFLLLLAATVHYVRMRNRERQEKLDIKKMEEINEAKLQFVYNITHEIRTPMTLIINPIEKLMANCRDNALRPVYTMIFRNSQRILSLLNQLMDVRRLEKGQMRMHFSETDMAGFIRDVMKPFEIYAREKNVELRFECPDRKVEAWVDLFNFDKVLMNLLSNAFKYTPSGGTITVGLSEGVDMAAQPPLDRWVRITVADTGIGIAPSQMGKIFDRFYRIENSVTQSSFGAGIGLHLVHSLVSLHHGTIDVRNNPDGRGCEFSITIPAGSDHLTSEELARTCEPESVPVERVAGVAATVGEEQQAADCEQRPKTRSRIMVVEDDAEIRGYISRELGDTYTIVAFSNAEEALEAALTESPMPDLIVSDVMMPGLDGITFTRKVKKGFNTNHIPVILLSARSRPEEVREALESGADYYVVKPFNTEVLKMTIASLLSNRRMLKVKYSGSQDQEDKVEKIELNSHDEVLMNKIMAVINEQISSPELSVESLAASVGISRVHLNRRLREITNQSARDFIRNIRLRQAARLLREKKLSIAEVAYATGYSNPSHFSVVFKEVFGTTPRAYAMQTDNEEDAAEK